MLTQRQLASLNESLRDHLVLSVYLDGAGADPARKPDARIALDKAIRAVIRDTSGRSHAERRELDLALAALDAQVASLAGTKAHGWVAFISNGEVQHVAGVSRSLSTLVRWQRGPVIAPYLKALAVSMTAMVLVGDQQETELYRLDDRGLTHIDHFHAHHALDEPAHLGRAPRTGFHTGTRGGTVRDRHQRALNAGTVKLHRLAADRAVADATPGTPILVAGPPQARASLVAALRRVAPEPIEQLPSIDVHSTSAEIARAAQHKLGELHSELTRKHVAELVEASGSRGSAAVGPEATDWALAQAKVHELLFTSAYLDANLDRVEYEVRSALAQGAGVNEVEGEAATVLDQHGGVAARLRYSLV